MLSILTLLPDLLVQTDFYSYLIWSNVLNCTKDNIYEAERKKHQKIANTDKNDFNWWHNNVPKITEFAENCGLCMIQWFNWCCFFIHCTSAVSEVSSAINTMFRPKLLKIKAVWISQIYSSLSENVEDDMFKWSRDWRHTAPPPLTATGHCMVACLLNLY